MLLEKLNSNKKIEKSLLLSNLARDIGRNVHFWEFYPNVYGIYYFKYKSKAKTNFTILLSVKFWLK